MRTRSIYAGFLVHATVAVLMDVLALHRRNALPTLIAPWSSRRVTFLHWHALIWIAWALAFAGAGDQGVALVAGAPRGLLAS